MAAFVAVAVVEMAELARRVWYFSLISFSSCCACMSSSPWNTSLIAAARLAAAASSSLASFAMFEICSCKICSLARWFLFIASHTNSSYSMRNSGHELKSSSLFWRMQFSRTNAKRSLEMNSNYFSSSSTFARRPAFPLSRLSFSLAASPRKITFSASNSCILGPTPIAMMWGGENLSASRRKTDRSQWSRVPARNRHCQRSKRGSQRFFVVSQSDLKERSGQGLSLETSPPYNLVKDLIAFNSGHGLIGNVDPFYEENHDGERKELQQEIEKSHHARSKEWKTVRSIYLLGLLNWKQNTTNSTEEYVCWPWASLVLRWMTREKGKKVLGIDANSKIC